MDVEAASKIINAVDEGWRVVSVCVPTRAVRVVTQDDKLFRVEQLSAGIITKWTILSSHKGDRVWEAFGVALTEAFKMQVRLTEKIKLAQQQRHMAETTARKAAGL